MNNFKIAVFLAVCIFGFGVIIHESVEKPEGQIRVVTENGITCAKNNNWSGQSCWREKE